MLCRLLDLQSPCFQDMQTASCLYVRQASKLSLTLWQMLDEDMAVCAVCNRGAQRT